MTPRQVTMLQVLRLWHQCQELWVCGHLWSKGGLPWQQWSWWRNNHCGMCLVLWSTGMTSLACSLGTAAWSRWLGLHPAWQLMLQDQPQEPCVLWACPPHILIAALYSQDPCDLRHGPSPGQEGTWDSCNRIRTGCPSNPGRVPPWLQGAAVKHPFLLAQERKH